MIGHCGPPTRLPHARTHTELARAARPIRRGQGPAHDAKPISGRSGHPGTDDGMMSTAEPHPDRATPLGGT